MNKTKLKLITNTSLTIICGGLIYLAPLFLLISYSNTPHLIFGFIILLLIPITLYRWFKEVSWKLWIGWVITLIISYLFTLNADDKRLKSDCDFLKKCTKTSTGYICDGVVFTTEFSLNKCK